MNSGVYLGSAFLLLIVMCCGATGGFAQPSGAAGSAAGYPNAPIRFIVPFAPGSGNDTVSRRIGQLLSESLHQSFIIENQAGAGGIIGIAQVTRAAPNGYTIGMGSLSTLAIGPYMMKNAPYDPVKDIAPITLIAAAPYVFVVNPRLPVNSLAEMVAYAKANPGKLNYSSSGIGTTHHLAVEMFNSIAGVDFAHVPFKGGAPATTAVVSGEITMIFGPILATVPFLQSKRLKALAVTSVQRSPVLPNVPSIAESGYPGYHFVNWYGIVAPAGTPQAIIERLNREIVHHLAAPDIRNQLSNDGAQVYGNTAKEFSDFIKSESEKSKKVIKALNLTPE